MAGSKPLSVVKKRVTCRYWGGLPRAQKQAAGPRGKSWLKIGSGTTPSEGKHPADGGTRLLRCGPELRYHLGAPSNFRARLRLITIRPGKGPFLARSPEKENDDLLVSARTISG